MVPVHSSINIMHSTINVSETPIWGTAPWLKISFWVPALHCQKAVSEQQDLETCPAPCQEVDPPQSSLTSMRQNGSIAFSRKTLDIDNAGQDHNKCQPLRLRFHSKDFPIVKLENSVLMVQSSYHCHEGRQCSLGGVISQGHNCLKLIREARKYFQSLVPWDRGA